MKLDSHNIILQLYYHLYRPAMLDVNIAKHGPAAKPHGMVYGSRQAARFRYQSSEYSFGFCQNVVHSSLWKDISSYHASDMCKTSTSLQVDTSSCGRADSLLSASWSRSKLSSDPPQSWGACVQNYIHKWHTNAKQQSKRAYLQMLSTWAMSSGLIMKDKPTLWAHLHVSNATAFHAIKSAMQVCDKTFSTLKLSLAKL